MVNSGWWRSRSSTFWLGDTPAKARSSVAGRMPARARLGPDAVQEAGKLSAGRREGGRGQSRGNGAGKEKSAGGHGALPATPARAGAIGFGIEANGGSEWWRRDKWRGLPSGVICRTPVGGGQVDEERDNEIRLLHHVGYRRDRLLQLHRESRIRFRLGRRQPDDVSPTSTRCARWRRSRPNGCGSVLARRFAARASRRCRWRRWRR